MPSLFCGHCCAQATYEATKPTVCFKCKRTYASAFADAVKTVAPIKVSAAPIEDPEPIRPRQTRARRHLAEYRDENGNLEEIDSTPDEEVNYREVRRQAKELKASIRWAVNVADEDEKPVTFGDHCCKPAQ